MKKLLLLFFSPLLFVDAYPQKDVYSDVLAEGKVWHFTKWPYDTRTQEGIRGDTLVLGRMCKKYGWIGENGSFSCFGVYYQDGSKVYRYNRSIGDFGLVYDFGVSVGDTVPWDDGYLKLKVTDVGSVRTKGHVLRRVSFRVAKYGDVSAEDGATGCWIEGIGGALGLQTPPVPEVGDYRTLLYVTCGDDTLYDVGIFNSPDFDKRMLTCSPSWVFSTYKWDSWDTGNKSWIEQLECRAYKTGDEYPSPKMFVYSAITVQSDGCSKILLREVGGKVYAELESYLNYCQWAFPEIDNPFEYAAEWPLDVLMYDFTLSAGDIYPCSGDVRVSYVSSMITRDSLERRVLFLDNGLEIIEGVGCVNSPFGVFAYQNDFGWSVLQKPAPSRASTSPFTATTLKSFAKYGGDDLVFVIGDEMMDVSCPHAVSSSSAAIYDLQGRRMKERPQKGVYIQDGRKYVVR